MKVVSALAQTPGAAVLLLGCLEPPLPANSAGESTLAAASKRAHVAAPAELIVWNGETAHDAGSGWASCQDERAGACETKLEALAGAGRDGGVALRFEARGSEWMGFGWNWLNWWPKDAGTDISERKSLTLAIKVKAVAGKAPEPFTIKIALGGSARDGQDATLAIPFWDHSEAFADGEWHEVTLPIGAMLRGSGEHFDTYRAWSFTVGAWNQGERQYEIFVDDVRFR